MPTDDLYSPVSVPKKTDNAGRPKGKAAYLVVFDWDDVTSYVRNKKGVQVVTFAFVLGKKPIAIYHTQSTRNVYHTSTGDDDARGFIHNADFDIPGSDLEVSEFFENNINKRLGVISIPIEGTDCKIAGTPGSPLFITKDDTEDSAKKNGHSVQMKSSIPAGVLGHIEKTLIPATDSATINAILGLTVVAPGSTGGGI